MPGEPVSLDVDLGQNTDHDVIVAPIGTLCCMDSPRLAGVDESHAKLLAESADTLPAILVQRGTMRVIDGMHRLRAAQLRQRTHIAIRYFDDDDEGAAFLQSVAENIAHGLPLTLADRKAAAARIMELNPEWSDRAVAKAAGLSGKTVAVIRQGNDNITELATRKGRDGKLRPVNGVAGRRRTSELLASSPDVSLRKLAAAAGVSRATAHDVRERLRRGEPPTTGTQRLAREPARVTRQVDGEVDFTAALNDLRHDPALRYTEIGRSLLRWLCLCPSPSQVKGMIAGLPAHCLPLVARLIRGYASRLSGMADLADERARDETG